MYGSSAAQGSRLASVLPGDTADTLLFTATMDTEVTRLFVCNVSGGAATFDLYHVEAGDIVSAESALFFNQPVAIGETLQVFADAPNSGIQLKAGDELWGASSVGSALAFNLYGVTASIAPGDRQ